MQGNIVEWKKKEGDELASGDILCMVETDKVDCIMNNSHRPLEFARNNQAIYAKFCITHLTQGFAVVKILSTVTRSSSLFPKTFPACGI